MKIVIFAGGYGTRMWPASRKSYPKQFFSLIGGKSFFQITVDRFKKAYSPEDIFVSTEQAYANYIFNQAPEIPKENVIIEPERRDNMPAVGLVAAIINKRFPDEVIMASWSDHFILKEDVFLNAIAASGEYVKETGMIVSINQPATYPSVQNEWIVKGEVLANKGGFDIFQILQTIKRPELPIAEQLFADKKNIINTGYRIWRADIMLSLFKEYAPNAYNHLQTIADAYGTDKWEEVLKREYHEIEKDSIEFAIFSKLSSDKSATISVDFDWRDAGTWDFFYKAMKKESEDNVVEGNIKTAFIDSKNNLIIGPDGKMIALIGLENFTVIDTKDALLVCPMDRTSEVKDVFKKVEEENPQFVE